jgi:surface antigen
MVYNIANRVVPTMPGNPVDWVSLDDNGEYGAQYRDDFDIHASGSSETLPDEGDLLVWDDSNPGHVAVITDVDENRNRVTVAQANTGSRTEHFFYQVNSEGVISFTGTGHPTHWLHQN